MSDEPKPLNTGGAPPRRPGLPGGPGTGAKGPRPARAPLPPPGPSAASLRLRAHLMIGIIVTCVALVGLIGWRVWAKMHHKDKTTIDVRAEAEEAVDKGKSASKDIFALETKVWGKSEELKPEDFAAIKGKLGELRDVHDKLKDLLDLIHARGLDDSADKAFIVPKWLQLKVWILDANDLLENPKPPDYGGLNIPMYVTAEKIRKAKEELKEINTTKDDIIKRNDPAEIKAVRKKIQDMREAFRGYIKKLQDLDEYVKN